MRIICALIALACLTSCNSQESKPKLTKFSGVAMTIPYSIDVGRSLSDDEKERIQHLIDNTFAEVDQIYNKFNPHSELSKLNSLDAYVTEPVSVELSEIFEQAASIVTLSEGRFDPTVEPAQRLWKEHLEVGCKPPEEAIESISKAVGWNHVHYSENQFWKENPDTRIDLSGIAKGLCVDMLTERLVAAGCRDVFVVWGGEICAHGQHPEGRPWTVFISRLQDTNPDTAIDYPTLQNEAIATSGDYLQQWKVGGTTYTHILNPENCRPLQVQYDTVAAVTVRAPTCALADALATATMLFPSATEAKIWAERVKERHPDVSFWIITRHEPTKE